VFVFNQVFVFIPCSRTQGAKESPVGIDRSWELESSGDLRIGRTRLSELKRLLVHDMSWDPAIANPIPFRGSSTTV
jgi:hypothetical protein